MVFLKFKQGKTSCNIGGAALSVKKFSLSCPAAPPAWMVPEISTPQTLDERKSST